MKSHHYSFYESRSIEIYPEVVRNTCVIYYLHVNLLISYPGMITTKGFLF